MSETNELLLQILFRNYDEEVARNGFEYFCEKHSIKTKRLCEKAK